MQLRPDRLNSPYERMIEEPREGATLADVEQGALSAHGALPGSHDLVPAAPAYPAVASPSGWNPQAPAEDVDPGAYTVAPGYGYGPLLPDDGWPAAFAGRRPGSTSSGSASRGDDAGVGSRATTSRSSLQRRRSTSKRIGRREAMYWVMGLAIVCLLSASALSITMLMRFKEGKRDRSSDRGLQFETKSPAAGESGFKFDIEYRPSWRGGGGDSSSTGITWTGRRPPFFTPTMRSRPPRQSPSHFTWLPISPGDELEPETSDDNSSAPTAGTESKDQNTTAGPASDDSSSKASSAEVSDQTSSVSLTDSSSDESTDSSSESSAESPTDEAKPDAAR
ncbi:uncharacterized protein LOC144124131 [Amblyomma americanum]